MTLCLTPFFLKDSFFRKGAAAFVLASLLLLGHVSLGHAVPIFGSTTNWRVAGNCNTAVTSQVTGGNSVSSTLSATTTAGLTTNCGSQYPAGGWDAQASAFASLGTGQLRAFASGRSPESNIDLFNSFYALTNVRVDANAEIFDTVRLIAPVGYAGGPNVRIPIRYDVDYDLSLESGGSYIRNQAALSWSLQTSSSIQNIRTNACDFAGVLSIFDGFYCDPFDIFHILFVPIANPEFFFRATLGARTSNSATADASATGSLSFELPAGFSFASDSGVLLQEVTSPPPPPPPGSSVPEPGSLALVALGLVGLLFRRR